MLYLKQIEVGPMGNFVYFIGDEEKKEVVLVDPAWQIDTLFRILQEEELTLKGVLITHSHYDHCNGIDELLEKQNVPIYIHTEELNFLESIGSSGGQLFGNFPKEHIKKVQSADKLQVGNIQITFIHTPGHTPGSQCFSVEDSLVAGDTLFVRGCGRCDLPGGNPEQMYESLTQKLMKFSDKTVLYPGHNYSDAQSSLIGEEKQKNPYFLCDSLKTFLNLTGTGMGGL